MGQTQGLEGFGSISQVWKSLGSQVCVADLELTGV